ncbi:MAG TPA: AAA family ATPase, partial [Actinomycetota bacterium]|nr:AAA family ATPase [Actinomycetota bacterium]
MDVPPHGVRAPPRAVERFVGRHGELAALNRVLDVLRTASSLGVQVAGEPGIGKTRLLGELAGQAEERSYLVVRGRATEFEVNLPFGVFVHALDEHLASLDLARLEHFSSELIPELSRVFPSLACQLGSGPAPLQEERHRAWRAVRCLLEALSAPRPLVCVLDDIHWADPASAELLSHLLRHPPQGSVLLAVAYRPSQLSPELAVSLDAAAREGLTERLELCPLTSQEATELLGADIDRLTGEALYQESGGNPFYLEQLARMAGHRPGAASSALGGLGQESVPLAVRSALAEELRGLSRPARVLLEGASVAGDPFELEIAAAAGGGIDETQCLGALDELLAAGLVRSSDSPRRFRFRHPIVRRGLYYNLRDGSRIGAHSRAAAALAARGASAAARAHHLERSAGVGNEEAIASLVSAAERAASGAPATAAHWYQAAVRLLPEGDRLDRRKLALLPPLAEALCSSGQLREGRGVLLEALDQLPSGEAALRVRLTASCAAIEHLLGRHSEARARLLRALGDVSHPASREAAVLKSELAIGALYVPDYEQTCRWAGEARATARALEDHLLAATASALLAYGACALGRTQQAEPPLRGAALLLDGLDDATLATGLEASFYLGWAEQFME